MGNTANPDDRWRPYAACANTTPQPFYASTHPDRRLCANCPTAEPCLWAAMALEQVLGYRYGVWGGTAALRRQRIALSLPADIDYTAWYRAVVDGWAAPLAQPAAAA